MMLTPLFRLSRALGGVISVATLFGGLVLAAPYHAAGQEVMFNQSALLRSLLPSVVNISIRREVSPDASSSHDAHASSATTSKSFVGSGFIIDPTGLIVTNYHVIDRAFDIVVTLADGTKLPGRIVNGARVADLALIRVEAGHPLPATHWGDSSKVAVGDPVFAIGNPLGVGQSVSAGIVSALNRDIMDSPYDNFIHTDAAINHGNSGGPMFNTAGEVVGVDTALISPTTGSTGLGFAIPSNEAKFVVDRLLTYGWVRPGWIGVKVQQVTAEMAAALALRQAAGEIISWITPDGPAAQAGLRVGDVMVQFGGQQPSDERALLRFIAEAAPGTQTTVSLLRDGRNMSVPITVQEWPRMQWEARDAPNLATPPRRTVPPDLGLTVGPITDAARVHLSDPKISGVLIAGVANGTDAADRGLQAGDVLLRIQDRPVTSKDDMMAALDAARAEQRPFVLALILPQTQDVPGPKWFALRLQTEP